MTVFSRHVSKRLAAYLDGELSSEDSGAIELHLGRCARCRAEYDQVRSGAAALAHLPVVEPPESVWHIVERATANWAAATGAPAAGHAGGHGARELRDAARWLPQALAARLPLLLILVLFLIVGVWLAVQRSTRPIPGWEIVRLDGAPAVGSRTVGGIGQVGIGEWVETDARSRAKVKIGGIGEVEVAPGTRIRVVAARADQQRLALERGEIHATIAAPPKLFLVDTASGTAVDLGCEYVLKSDEDGFGLLRVTKGWVAFQWNGLESLVPAGARCDTRPYAGPGVPYFEDAPSRLKDALASFAFEKSADDALTVILAESRVRDTLTLWHLVPRVDIRDRERVYDRIAALAPVPGVARDEVLRLDPDTLRRWKEELAWRW